MTDNRHYSVLKNEVLEHFTKAAKISAVAPIFVDCTLGGAGHTEALLRAIPDSKVIACDLDLSAIEKAKVRLKEFTDRVFFLHANFKDLNLEAKKIPKDFQAPWSGVLLDLGYSSNQLEDPSYGMSFMLTEGAALDMRLTRPPAGETAWDILVNYSTEELAEIFKAYGEIQHSKKTAHQIKEAIKRGDVTNTTKSLATFLFKTNPRDPMHPASLVFQALRIAVNDELRNLDTFLKNATLLLRQKGVLAVITFHSLEDRIVKHWGVGTDAVVSVTKKPILPTDSEISENSRSRSAKLRIFERKV